MKVYISGRITGLEYQEAYKKFEDAEVEVKNMGGVPVNPMKLEHKPNYQEGEKKKSIRRLLRKVCFGILNT